MHIFTRIFKFLRVFRYPVATIMVGETWKDAVAPKVVSFSSRGPSPVTPDILKVKHHHHLFETFFIYKCNYTY